MGHPGFVILGRSGFKIQLRAYFVILLRGCFVVLRRAGFVIAVSGSLLRPILIHGSRRRVWLVCAATAAGVNGSAKVAPLYQSFHWSRK